MTLSLDYINKSREIRSRKMLSSFECILRRLIEKNVLNVITHDEDHEDQIIINHKMIDFSELSVAFLISAIFKDLQRRSFDIKNRRYIHHNMNSVT
jgi:hypothetical protein